ncbi:hypothetical protein F2Q68_00003904 [Brassica cretica]|uniref:Uncharacterized protein n=2 Tax=Brassica cretica TaxID=69181 RepID=A0ABQ7BF65_BRACR|nr:hypothetical protein F2Q68_00003904 [Brassica cretica]KAF3530942.1 hypothetical protein DY000_02038850 [Brassica cretica]
MHHASPSQKWRDDPQSFDRAIRSVFDGAFAQKHGYGGSMRSKVHINGGSAVDEEKIEAALHAG